MGDAETVEIPDDAADAAPVAVERRDHPVWGREVTVTAAAALFGPEYGPEKLRDLAAVLEASAAWLEAGQAVER